MKNKEDDRIEDEKRIREGGDSMREIRSVVSFREYNVRFPGELRDRRREGRGGGERGRREGQETLENSNNSRSNELPHEKWIGGEKGEMIIRKRRREGEEEKGQSEKQKKK